MSDHYCCKACGMRYDVCSCQTVEAPILTIESKIQHLLEERHKENLRGGHTVHYSKKKFMHCLGVKKKGYWKGNPCNHFGMLQTEDLKWWCRSHLPIGMKVVASREQ